MIFKKKYLQVVFLIFLTSFLYFNIQMVEPKDNSHGKKNNFVSSDLELFNTEQIIDISIVFIDYESTDVDLDLLQYIIPPYLWSYSGMQYSIDYSFHFADDHYERKFNRFIDRIAVEDSTVDINETALNLQAVDGHVRDIFIEQEGTGISAEKVEKWFHRHPYDRNADLNYYVLNLSRYDTVNHDQEHWFTVKEENVDTGIQRHWWRNEWDFPINFDAKFPYAGFSQEYRDYFFDPTAFQWYTRWNAIWFDIPEYYRLYYTQDLDEYMKYSDDATFYIGEWLLDVILMQNYVWTPSYGESISAQIVVFQNVSHLGFTNDDLSWTISEDKIKGELEKLQPNADVNIEITFYEWSEFPDLNVIFENSELDPAIYYGNDPPIPDYKYYDGYNVFYSLWDDYYANQFFDYNAADVVAGGYVFILDNATFAYPGLWSGGGLFTGLGGGGSTIQLMELDRLYYPNTDIPRQGFSHVLIHEIGHAIGFPHTFGAPYVASDFIGDVMGYYPGISEYSQVRIEAFQREAVNTKLLQQINPLLEPIVINKDNYKLKDIIILKIYQNMFYRFMDRHWYSKCWDLLSSMEDFILSIEPIV